MDYSEALHRVLSLADYERMAGRAAPAQKVDLSRMEELVRRMGHPERCAPVVHIAGTKGKGSVAAMVTSVLTAAGYRAGLFTSPHLHIMRERVRIGRELVSEREFAELVESLWPVLEALGPVGSTSRPTTFELLTAMAFTHFQRRAVDVQVLEVGLGGRLDSTNVARGDVCVITSLSLDHTEVLGDSLEEIAAEKAGIVKAGSVVVSAPQDEVAAAVIQETCHRLGATLHVAGRDATWQRGLSSLEGQTLRVRTSRAAYDFWMPLLGGHQLENAAIAVLALEALEQRGFAIGPKEVAQGMALVEWPARLEVVGRRPLVVVDGAHNAYSMGRLVQSVREYFTYRRVITVFGCSANKDLEGMATELASLGGRMVVTGSRHPRATPTERLAAAFQRLGVAVQEVEEVMQAVQVARALASPDDLVLATGSLFVAAEAIQSLRGIAGERYPEMEPPRAGTPAHGV
ncbi:MAG: bifunctional folylpolyglutamate synthase/dihydrofolate synthase [Chloroflexi bacterium]|nr:bifunctional folylpolyglutamate synthase/dihydrofolate synthase [Chloroflexota bacterium]